MCFASAHTNSESRHSMGRIVVRPQTSTPRGAPARRGTASAHVRGSHRRSGALRPRRGLYTRRTGWVAATLGPGRVAARSSPSTPPRNLPRDPPIAATSHTTSSLHAAGPIGLSGRDGGIGGGQGADSRASTGGSWRRRTGRSTTTSSSSRTISTITPHRPSFRPSGRTAPWWDAPRTGSGHDGSARSA